MGRLDSLMLDCTIQQIFTPTSPQIFGICERLCIYRLLCWRFILLCIFYFVCCSCKLWLNNQTFRRNALQNAWASKRQMPDQVTAAHVVAHVVAFYLLCTLVCWLSLLDKDLKLEGTEFVNHFTYKVDRGAKCSNCAQEFQRQILS